MMGLAPVWCSSPFPLHQPTNRFGLLGVRQRQCGNHRQGGAKPASDSFAGVGGVPVEVRLP